MRIHEITHRPRTRPGQREYGHSRPSNDGDERAYHAAFKPYLRCETEREVPQPIFIAGMLGVANLKVVPLPASTWTAPENNRDEIVKAAIRQHYRRTQGRVARFGAITGYSLVIKPSKEADFAVPYNIDGDRSGSLRTVPRLGTVTLSAGGQRLSKSIWSRHGHGGRD